MVNYDSSGLALDVLFINDGNGNFTEVALVLQPNFLM